MCTLLGYSSNAISVVGLFCDLAGFGLLARDLMSDYGKTRRRLNLLVAAGAAERLSKISKQQFEDASRPPITDDAAASLEELTRQLQRLNAHSEIQQDYLAVLAMAYELKWYDPRLPFNLADSYDFSRRFSQEAHRVATTVHKRPPIYIGVALILLGFALQIAGAWPC